MNHYSLQQNAFESRGFVVPVSSDPISLVCPKPRRVILSNNVIHPFRLLHSSQSRAADVK
ncbi:unnamed protein product [Brassica napus]|uniref:(rape) hypothetical protein n=1 Tax=Brassica napus TaxID=3708 RepID=A0A816I6X6_BRANA|nr:unnamed protein product [Brassica napus]